MVWSLRAGAFGLAVMGWATVADAQTQSGRDPAAAEALFREGVEALQRQDMATACPKFRASMDLDPAVSTLINIAKCHQHEGKLARAWSALQSARVLNRETVGVQRQQELEAYIAAASAALEPRLSRLRIAVRVPPAQLTVARDGEPLPASVLGQTFPVDPGTHQVVASAPGYRTETRSVTLSEGQTAEIEILLTAEAPAALPFLPTSPPAAAPLPPPSAPPPPAPTGDDEGTPTWAWIAGGVGLAASAAAIGFAVDHASAASTIDEDCPTANEDGSLSCDPAKHDQGSIDDLAARRDRSGGLAIGFGALGVVGLGAMVVGLVATSGDDRIADLRLWWTPTGAGASFSGTL